MCFIETALCFFFYILFYSTLFYSILFYYILFSSPILVLLGQPLQSANNVVQTLEKEKLNCNLVTLSLIVVNALLHKSLSDLYQSRYNSIRDSGSRNTLLSMSIRTWLYLHRYWFPLVMVAEA